MDSFTDIYVYVRFSTNKEGFSFEPRKWLKILRAGCLTEYSEHVVAFGESESPVSFNLKLRVRPNELTSVLGKLRGHFTGCEEVGLFVPNESTPKFEYGPAAKIIEFRRAVA